MLSLADTIAQISRLNRSTVGLNVPAGRDRLMELENFGSNPGALRAKLFVPAKLQVRPALVVVLHGCTQTAAGYDLGSGWSQLADRYGFVLLFPEQQRRNNPNLCFNWFVPEDSRRGSGEALSIQQMIAAMIDRHDIDATQVFVTGLSAGGAMASVMLATYPDVFAGGAIIAGLPYGCASTIPQALERMGGRGGPTAPELAALVLDASDHRGPWPTLSIWHGSGDATVNPTNSSAIVDQWRELHGVGAEPTRTEAVDGYPRRVWCDDGRREVIEEYSITGMGHGTPLDTLSGDGCGQSGAYMLETSISSTHHICRFWGLARESEGSEALDPVSPALPKNNGRRALAAAPLSDAQAQRVAFDAPAPSETIGKAIEGALRAAGLMR